MIGSFPILFFLVWKCIADTNYFSEDVVIPPKTILEGVNPIDATVQPEENLVKNLELGTVCKD